MKYNNNYENPIMPDIHFRPMEEGDIPVYLDWAKRDHVKTVWFIDGYEPPDYIHTKVEGNGYDFPFILLLDDQPIGYIVYCDLYAYKNICKEPSGVFTDEPPGSYCIDLFIGEEAHLNKGYGTQLVKKFSDMLLTQKQAKRVLIDPSPENTRAIRCYEKAGFKPIRKGHNGREEVIILEKRSTTCSM